MSKNNKKKKKKKKKKFLIYFIIIIKTELYILPYIASNFKMWTIN